MDRRFAFHIPGIVFIPIIFFFVLFGFIRSFVYPTPDTDKVLYLSDSTMDLADKTNQKHWRCTYHNPNHPWKYWAFLDYDHPCPEEYHPHKE